MVTRLTANRPCIPHQWGGWLQCWPADSEPSTGLTTVTMTIRKTSMMYCVPLCLRNCWMEHQTVPSAAWKYFPVSSHIITVAILPSSWSMYPCCPRVPSLHIVPFPKVLVVHQVGLKLKRGIKQALVDKATRIVSVCWQYYSLRYQQLACKSKC